MIHKIGRNDLCPCGSGKKFKKCCMGKSVSDLPFKLSGPFDDDSGYDRACIDIDEAESDMFRSMGLLSKTKLSDRSSLLTSNLGVSPRTIPCSNEGEADDLAFNLCLGGHRTGVSCINGVYTVFVFD